MGHRSMPNQKVKGTQSNGNKYCVWYQNRSLGRWPVNYIQSQARGITLTTRCTGASGFDHVELWVMGPPCGFKVGKALTSCTVMLARHGREYRVGYVGNNVSTKGEGRKEPFSCSWNEADHLARFSSIGGYRNVINKCNRVLLRRLYTKVFT